MEYVPNNWFKHVNLENLNHDAHDLFHNGYNDSTFHVENYLNNKF